MVKKEALDAIESRANAATPGPWIDHVDSASDGILIACTFGAAVDYRIFASDPPILRPDEDRRFICAARTDVADLLAEVRRLQLLVDGIPSLHAHVAELRKAIRVMSTNEGQLHARIADLETQLLGVKR